jgi:hypothetical protein
VMRWTAVCAVHPMSCATRTIPFLIVTIRSGSDAMVRLTVRTQSMSPAVARVVRRSCVLPGMDVTKAATDATGFPVSNHFLPIRSGSHLISPFISQIVPTTLTRKIVPVCSAKQTGARFSVRTSGAFAPRGSVTAQMIAVMPVMRSTV